MYKSVFVDESMSQWNPTSVVTEVVQVTASEGDTLVVSSLMGVDLETLKNPQGGQVVLLTAESGVRVIKVRVKGDGSRHLYQYKIK
jgi:hypothetical protein